MSYNYPPNGGGYPPTTAQRGGYQQQQQPRGGPPQPGSQGYPSNTAGNAPPTRGPGGPRGYPGMNGPPAGPGGYPGYPGMNATPPPGPPRGAYPGNNTGPPKGYPNMNSTPPPMGGPPRGHPGQNSGPSSGPRGYPNTGPPSGPVGYTNTGPGGYPNAGPPSMNSMPPRGPPNMGHPGPARGMTPPPHMMNSPGRGYPGAGPPAGPGGYNQGPSYPGTGAPPPNMSRGPPSAGQTFTPTMPPPSRGHLGPGSSQPQVSAMVAIDESLQSDARFIRSSVSAVPNSRNLQTTCGIPLSVIMRPLAEPSGDGITPVVNFGTCGVIRCKKCRTYINPFVSFIENGRRWKCNLCGILNDVPAQYYAHLDSNGKRSDWENRPELLKGQVEFVAPLEYMVRPPQAPVFFFALDVSRAAVSNGSLVAAVETIKSNLDKLSGAPRTQIGFITYDSTVHFYNLKSSLKSPQMLVVSDFEDLFLPSPDDLLVNLSTSRHVVDTLLDSLPTMFAQTTIAESCLGAALTAVHKVVHNIGGKVLIFQSVLPTSGPGALVHRDNPKLIGTEQELKLLQPSPKASGFYKQKALDLSRAQASIDLFLFSQQYTDVSTLSLLTKLTGGELYFYPGYDENIDGTKFRAELTHNLTRQTGWESVMRIRVSQGFKVNKFYGNFFVRGQDLLAIPCCNSDSTLALEFGHDPEGGPCGSVCYIQGALLYTTSSGERRIRVHTLAMPTTNVPSDVFEGVDIDVLCNVQAKTALESTLSFGVNESRKLLQQKCVDILRAHRSATGGGYTNRGKETMPLPASLQLLPLYIMSLQKNVTFRGGAGVSADMRSYFIHQLNNMEVERSKFFFYPRMFALHGMAGNCGLPLRDGEEELENEMYEGEDQIRMPPLVNLSADNLTSDGAFLLEDGLAMMLWLGRDVSPKFIEQLFGISSFEGVQTLSLNLEPLDNDVSTRMCNIVSAIRDPSQRSVHQRLYVLLQGEPMEARFAWYLVEDRANFPGGGVTYVEYLNVVNSTSLGMGASTIR